MFLIINIGSTSVKTKLFDANLNVIGQLNADYSMLSKTVIKTQLTNKTAYLTQAFTSVEDLLRFVFAKWRDYLQNQHITLNSVSHRIVHGGSAFHEITIVDNNTMEELIRLDSYAPLHNPVNRIGITIADEIFSKVIQYAVFDTAFHHYMPELASRYPLPDAIIPDLKLRRYGFHGISCSYALGECSTLINGENTRMNLIVLHLGGGSSATAIKSGISVDTTMGFSPLGGLMMNSRCGDLDPMVPITLLRNGLSLIELDQVLQSQSGLRAIAKTGDMRSILEQASNGDGQAQLAIDMYCYQIKKMIGAYHAILGSVSALVFTGGIGENCPEIRKQIVEGLELLGISIDRETNQQSITSYLDIAKSHCKTRCFVIKCNEELEIARQVSGYQSKA